MWVPAPQSALGPLEAGLSPDELRMPEALGGLEVPPVFVAGSARSGTTFTLDVFGQHPEVCTLFETWLFTQTHGLTSIFAQREWDPLVSRSAWERAAVQPAAVQLLSYREMVGELGDLVATWLMRAVRQEHRFLVLKEPLDVHAAAIMFPEARFVHVIRDGRDVALSMRRASESWNTSMGVGLPMSWRAEAWRRQVENVTAHREYLGSRYLEIRFEDLRADVVATARTLFDFAGIPYDDRVLELVRAGTELSSYSETARLSGFRGAGAIGAWREQFSRRDAIGFNRAAGDLLVELGYERDRSWWRELLPAAFQSRTVG